MESNTSDSYIITFHRTRDHTRQLRGGARREPTTPSGRRRIWEPPIVAYNRAAPERQDPRKRF